MRFIVLAIAAALPISGCAIHPLPDDVTGVDTYTIVRQIRCETRQAVADSAVGWLTAPDNEDRVDPASRAIGFEFANGRPIQDFKPSLFKGRVRAIVELFFETGVAYNFQIEMTETNNLGTDINLLKPFTSSTFTLGIKADAKRSRKNDRVFTLTDNFRDLVGLPDSYCDGRSIQANYSYLAGKNYAYPIAGKIGVKRLVQDFITLTLFGNLGGKEDKPDGPPTLVDALEFETFVSGSLEPKIVFTPAGNALQVQDATLTGQVSRKDLHKVTMGLSIAGSGVKLVKPVRTTLFTTPFVSARPATSAEANALNAVDQYLWLKIFKPTLRVEQ